MHGGGQRTTSGITITKAVLPFLSFLPFLGAKMGSAYMASPSSPIKLLAKEVMRHVGHPLSVPLLSVAALRVFRNMEGGLCLCLCFHFSGHVCITGVA